MSDARLHPADVQQITKVVFAKDRLSGAEVAERIGVSYQTLYGWFKDRGVPLSAAYDMSTILTSWAVEILELSMLLREKADQAVLKSEREEAERRLALLNESPSWRRRMADALVPSEEVEAEMNDHQPVVIHGDEDQNSRTDTPAETVGP